MRREAIFIPTGQGPIGAIVHRPEGEAHAMALVLAGAGPRFGVNRTFARLSDALAADGLVVLRPDHAERGDSSQVAVSSLEHASPKDARPTVEAVRSFRHSAGDLDLVIIARCYGLFPALELACDEGVRGITLLAPGVRKWRRGVPGPEGPLRRRLRALSRRFGRPVLAPSFPPEFLDMLDEAASRTQVSFLLGGEAPPWDRLALESLEAPLRDRVQLEVVEGMTLEPASLPDQDLLIDLVRDRLRAYLHLSTSA